MDEDETKLKTSQVFLCSELIIALDQWQRDADSQTTERC